MVPPYNSADSFKASSTKPRPKTQPPPVYRPQLQTTQLKPGAPSIYRPQLAAVSAPAIYSPQAAQFKRAPASGAPPVYRPHPIQAIQQKPGIPPAFVPPSQQAPHAAGSQAVLHGRPAGSTPGALTGPPVYRPQPAVARYAQERQTAGTPMQCTVPGAPHAVPQITAMPPISLPLISPPLMSQPGSVGVPAARKDTLSHIVQRSIGIGRNVLQRMIEFTPVNLGEDPLSLAQPVDFEEEIEKEINKDAYRNFRAEFNVEWPSIAKENPGHVELILDSGRIQRILSNEVLIRDALSKLNSEVEKYIDKHGTTKKALTTVLSKREMEYGLGGSVPIYAGILSAAAFQKVAREGRLFKDTGVTPTHGEYTHRIQWYIVLYGMSKGFKIDLGSWKETGFHYQPKELLIAINNSGVNPSVGFVKGKLNSASNLWDALFDYASFMKSTIKSGVTSPENFMLSLMDNTPFPKPWLKRRGYAPTVAGIVEQRHNKRVEELKKPGAREAYNKKKIESGKYYELPEFKNVLFQK